MYTQFLDNQFSTPPNPQHNAYYPPTPLSSQVCDTEQQYWNAAAFSEALALLQQPANLSASNDFYIPDPSIRIETSTPAPLPPAGPSNDCRIDSAVSGIAPSYEYWPMYHNYNNSMGGPVAAQKQGLKRQRSHQRTPSASTVASYGPASPYTHNTSYPQIANTDYSPNSPGHFESSNTFADQAPYSKNLPTPSQTPTDGLFANAGYMPSQAAHTPAAHLAMKGFAIDHHNLEDLPLDFAQSGRHSLSSMGQDSPSTPRSAMGDEMEPKQYQVPGNGNGEITVAQDRVNDCLQFDSGYRQVNPDVQLSRTESAADESVLYNPANFNATPAAPKQQQPGQFLSPPHRNLISERLQTANIARSVSPTSAVSRERSPFRQGSPMAPQESWNSPRPTAGTLATMRQQQKEDAEQAEYAQHVPNLQREPTKTISPKDALLDYTGEEQPSLFQDTVPAGYRQHYGGTEQYQSNFGNQAGPAYTGLPATSQQNMANFRAATSADGFSGTNFNFPPPTYQGQGQIQSNPFHQDTYQAANNMNSYPATSMAEPTPDFPAHLTSMESSVSDNGRMPSSQGSEQTSAPQRPADTRAGTGTYTCTYHGCAQRFESHANLQKHKRDFHRSQQQDRSAGASSASGTASASPRSTESPAPSSSGGMTSAALLARNSQAGPHKCTRINPSTNKPCNTVFSRPYDLTRHEDTIHNNRKQKVRCPMCREEKTFSRNDALTRHMRVVHPEVEQFGKRSKRD